jgi:hypothetical protein
MGLELVRSEIVGAGSQLGEENIGAHILIVVSWLGVANGAVISTQEFTSGDRCDAARIALIEYAKARSADETLRPMCLQKRAVAVVRTSSRPVGMSQTCQEQTLPEQRTEHLQCDQLLIGPGLCHSRNTNIPSCYHSVTDFGRCLCPSIECPS